MCEQCGDDFHKGIITGTELGIRHLEHNDWYYPGLNQFYVEYDDMKKHVTISPTGIKRKYGEEPIDKYIEELLFEMRTGLRGGNKKEHISNVFKKFSDRKFEDKSWWGDLTEAEMNELLAGVRAYWLPHTAMLESGLAEAFIFGKFSKQLTENMSLEATRKKVKNLGLSKFDQARIDYVQNTSKIFWDKAISRETDSAVIQLLKYNRDVTTEIIKNPGKKSWRSLTSDVYHGIKKDEAVVMRDLDRIVLTETSYSQNSAILYSGQDSGAKYVFFQVRPTACKICKGMYLDENGRPKRFLISDIINLPRDVGWGKKPDELAPQLVPHPFCYCRAYTE